ncbi:18119_t:CDS:1 [Dentiscutata erythropus]|uniref:18119_t:CDS:1 n=1 Tax=Dentiscutata erythropus TaxID=1348616 RepID=A0A9N9A0U5_9GLOM|nr:18119_t:CDS:1 [Dentiscutata erythropus]
MFIQLQFFYTVPEFTEFWCRLYGDIVGVWMNGEYTIITCDAEFAQRILSDNNSKNFIIRMGNDHGLKEIGMYKNGIIWNNDVSKWTHQKHIFQAGLASNARQRAFNVAVEKTRQEINRIKTSALKNNNTPTVDLLNVFRHITLAIILEVSLGIQLDLEKSQNLIDCVVEYFKAWEFFLLKPRFIWPLFPLKLFHHRKSVLKLQKEIQNIISIIDPQATTFLSQLYSNNLTNEEIQQSILEMVLAGTDTSSVSLYYTILLLTENKKIVNQLIDSLDDSLDDSLLEAVLRESMRLMPVGPVIIRKSLNDCEISGIHIKASTNIVISLARMNRNQKWFDDPLKFDPQRFIKNKNLITLSAPMGVGPKSCVGQHFAMVEMKAILPELLKEFIFTRMDETRPIIDTRTRWDVAQQPVVKEILNVLPRKKVVFVGAHSVGKTTLARFIKNKMNGILVSEIARTLIKELNLNADILRNDPDKSLEFQASIIKAQCAKEEEIEHEFAILDRSALDALVYAQTFCGKRWNELLDMEETNKCLERYRQKNKYMIFLIEPQKECLRADGVRMMPTDYEDWISFSESFKNIMNEYNIEFNAINVLDINQRYSIIRNALFAHNI